MMMLDCDLLFQLFAFLFLNYHSPQVGVLVDENI